MIACHASDSSEGEPSEKRERAKQLMLEAGPFVGPGGRTKQELVDAGTFRPGQKNRVGGKKGSRVNSRPGKGKRQKMKNKKIKMISNISLA